MAEGYAIVYASDDVYVARKRLEVLLGYQMEIKAIVDSRELLNVITKDSDAAKKKLYKNI